MVTRKTIAKKHPPRPPLWRVLVRRSPNEQGWVHVEAWDELEAITRAVNTVRSVYGGTHWETTSTEQLTKKGKLNGKGPH